MSCFGVRSQPRSSRSAPPQRSRERALRQPSSLADLAHRNPKRIYERFFRTSGLDAAIRERPEKQQLQGKSGASVVGEVAGANRLSVTTGPSGAGSPRSIPFDAADLFLQFGLGQVRERPCKGILFIRSDQIRTSNGVGAL